MTMDPCIKEGSRVQFVSKNQRVYPDNDTAVVIGVDLEDATYEVAYDSSREIYWTQSHTVRWLADCTREELLTHHSASVRQLAHCILWKEPNEHLQSYNQTPS